MSPATAFARALGLAARCLLLSSLASAACIPFSEAPKKIGAETCVAGTVLKVAETPKGTWFLDFCEDYRQCPFSVVIFASDLKDVGDVRRLQGKTIEIWGRIKSYGGRAEIILSHARQLRGDAGKLPPLPRDYDVTRRGGYSATAPGTSQSTRPTGRTKSQGAFPSQTSQYPRDPEATDRPDPPR